jgi:D-amino-acid dehydrogenase
MTTVILGAGAVGTATAWYLRKAGHDVVLVERQMEAAMETSWGNGGVIHASEVEPWSQPGMPLKIIKWLGKENAPLLLRYGAIPHILRWGIDFARNCAPERFRENAKSNLHLALHSLKSLQEIGAETGISYDRATRGVAQDISVRGIPGRR